MFFRLIERHCGRWRVDHRYLEEEFKYEGKFNCKLIVDSYKFITEETTLRELIVFLRNTNRMDIFHRFKGCTINDYGRLGYNFPAIAIEKNNFKLFEDIIEHDGVEPFTSAECNPLSMLIFQAAKNNQGAIRSLEKVLDLLRDEIDMYGVLSSQKKYMPEDIRRTIVEFINPRHYRGCIVDSKILSDVLDSDHYLINLPESILYKIEKLLRSKPHVMFAPAWKEWEKELYDQSCWDKWQNEYNINYPNRDPNKGYGAGAITLYRKITIG